MPGRRVFRPAACVAGQAHLGDPPRRRRDGLHVTRPRALIRRTWWDTRLRSQPIWAASTVIGIRLATATGPTLPLRDVSRKIIAVT